MRSPPNWPTRRTTAAQEARAAIAGIQAQLDLAKLNLSFTRVTSPISGRVSRADITAGNLVTADATALTSVVSTDKVYAYFDADERVYLASTPSWLAKAAVALPPRFTWACRMKPATRTWAR